MYKVIKDLCMDVFVDSAVRKIGFFMVPTSLHRKSNEAKKENGDENE